MNMFLLKLILIFCVIYLTNCKSISSQVEFENEIQQYDETNHFVDNFLNDLDNRQNRRRCRGCMGVMRVLVDYAKRSNVSKKKMMIIKYGFNNIILL